MEFTRQDALTFGLGALAALGLELSVWLIRLQVEAESPDFSFVSFGVSMAVGLGAALGRYLATRLPDIVARLRR